MKIKCPNCNAAYDMDESRVPAAGVNIKCPRCQNPFRVTKQGVAPSGASAPPPAKPAAPPAASMHGEAVPLPAPDRGPAARPPTAPPPGRPPGAIAPSPPPAPPPPAVDMMAGLPPLDSDGAMPPGWGNTGHPAQARGPSASRAPLTANGMGSAVPLPARNQPAASATAATMHVANPFDPPSFDVGGEAQPDPFAFGDFGAPEAPPAPPPAADPGFDVDFGDPGAAQAVAMQNAPAGGFDFSGLNTVSMPQRDPALDAALAMSGTPVPGADPFGYAPGDPFAPPPPAPTSMGGGEMLDFVDDAAGEHHASGPIRWQVRRKSGKIFGPFEPAAIVAMLQQGQLFGNEDISQEGSYWMPLASEPTFAPYVKTEIAPEPPGLAPAAAAPRMPPPMIPTMAAANGPNSIPAGTVPFEPAPEPKAKKKGLGSRAVPVWVRLLMRRMPVLIASAVVVVLLLGGVALGKFTEYGYFGMKFFAGKRPNQRTTGTKAIETYYGFAAEGTFAGSQKALGTIQTAITEDEENPEALANYAAITCRLSRRYGSKVAKSEFEKAKVLATKHLDRKTTEGRVGLAAIALCEGGNKLADGKALLEPVASGVRADTLFAELLLALKDNKGAAAHLDTVIAARASGEAAMLRAEAAMNQDDEVGLEASLLKAQEVVPGHARARLWLARLRVNQKKLDDGAAILKEILVDPVVRNLDASEEALGHHLFGDVLVEKRQFADAAKEYQRAADIEPEGVQHRTALAALTLRLRQWPEAVAAYEKALERASGDAELLTGAGIAYTHVGNYTEATKKLDEAKKNAPNSPAVLVANGDLQTALQHYPEAHKFYGEALTKDEKYVPAIVADARLLLKEQKLDDAKARVEKGIELAPENARVQALLGHYSLLTKDMPKAKEAFQKAVSLDADEPEYHGGLADALTGMNEYPEAKTAYEKAVSIDGKDIGLRQRFAQLLRLMNDNEGALKQLDDAMAVDAKDARLQSLRGAVLLDLDRATEAETALKAALAIKDDEAIAHDYYGRLLSTLKNDTNKAVEHLKRAVEIEPKNAQIRYQLGLVYERGQLLIDATEAFKTALKLDPKHIDAQEHLAAVLTAQTNYAEAMETYKKVIEKDPKRVTAVAALGDCAFKAGEIDEAIKYFKQALTADAKLGAVQYKLGRAYDKKGNGPEAEKAYLAATKLDPKNPWPYYYLGYAYKGRGKRKEAVEMFKQYLTNNKDAKDVEEINDEISYLAEGR